MMRILLVSFILLQLSPAVATGQAYSQFQEQLKRIFDTKEYDAAEPKDFHWMPGGASYSVIGPGAGDSTIMVCGIESGGCTEKVKTKVPIESYEWSPDGAKILVFANSVRNWSSETPTYVRKGDYWLIDVASGATRKIAAGAKPSTIMLAKFSPDARRVGYVRASDIFVEDVASGRTRRLTTTGSATLLNGRADWAYEEELSLGDGFRWSHDSRRIAFLQFDISKEGVFTLLNNTDSQYPEAARYPYPLVGTPNARVRLGIVDAERGDVRWMGVEGDPELSYLARFEWKDATHLSVLKLNRRQNVADILILGTTTRDVQIALHDTSERWIDMSGDPLWLRDGESVLWLTEKDGWRRVCRSSASSGKLTVITRFEADVTEIVGVDDTANYVYFIASPKSALDRYIYRTRLDGSGEPERLSPAGQEGTHQYRLSPDAKWALHMFSRFDAPPRFELIRMPGHQVVQTLADNREFREKVAMLPQPTIEFFQVESEPGVKLDGWMMRPQRLDPAKKYPLILYVYGEPASQTVTQEWGSARRARYSLFHRALTGLGFIVVSVDPRGTPSLKGTECRQQIYGSIGPLASRDFAAAVTRLEAEHPYIDAGRVGVWGRSGGTSTLNLMFRYPDVFSAGISVAPVPDQRLYDTIYQERYMGTPETNPKGYAESPIQYAQDLRGRLLVIHGSGDDNVHIQGTERLLNKLIESGKLVDFMEYPNRSHFLFEGNGTIYHQHLTMGRYFYDQLKPGK